MTAVEFCVDGSDALAAADAIGADTLELCVGLPLGGLTPSHGLLEQAQTAATPVHVLVRPRSGGFCYSAPEVDQMVRDVARVRGMGLSGIVIGATTQDQSLDKVALEALVAAAEGLSVTLHRAIDTVSDPWGAIDTAVELGMARILTSGGAARAPDGAILLEEMVRYASGRIRIIAGAGLTSANVGSLVEHTGVDGVHGSCGSRAQLLGQSDLFEDGARRVFDPLEARAFLKNARRARRP